MFKWVANKEEELFNWLVERWADKDPDTFWSDDRPKPRSRRWESWILNYWPYKLTFGYWYYLLHDLSGTDRSHGHNYSDEFPNWINWPEWGEWRYLGQYGGWGDIPKRRSLKWAWSQLTEETKGRRLICRLRGHPRGEVYYNPGGLEPDHRCKDCGEEIG